jgi:hypothetical protein
MKPNNYKPKENPSIKVTYRAKDVINEYIKQCNPHDTQIDLVSNIIISALEPYLTQEVRDEIKNKYFNEEYAWFTEGNFIKFNIECSKRNKEKVFNLLDKLPDNEKCGLFHIEPYIVRTFNRTKLMIHLKGKRVLYKIPVGIHANHCFFVIRNENLASLKKLIEDTLDEIKRDDVILLKITLNETKDLSVIEPILNQL